MVGEKLFQTNLLSRLKGIKFCRRLFMSSLKSKIRQFHIVVKEKRQRNVQKSETHLQSSCFAY